MEHLETVYDFIDMRSFSNLWYWIVLAVLWSSLSYFVLGVPLDMIRRGRSEGGQAQEDVETLIRITAHRVLHLVDESPAILLGLGSFWMSGLMVLAFYYELEFAQALFFLLAPISLVAWLSIRLCRRIVAEGILGDALYRRLIVQRRLIQVIGMVAIFVTAMFGMWTNVNTSILN